MQSVLSEPYRVQKLDREEYSRFATSDEIVQVDPSEIVDGNLLPIEGAVYFVGQGLNQWWSLGMYVIHPRDQRRLTRRDRCVFYREACRESFVIKKLLENAVDRMNSAENAEERDLWERRAYQYRERLPHFLRHEREMEKLDKFERLSWQSKSTTKEASDVVHLIDPSGEILPDVAQSRLEVGYNDGVEGIFFFVAADDCIVDCCSVGFFLLMPGVVGLVEAYRKEEEEAKYKDPELGYADWLAESRLARRLSDSKRRRGIISPEED